MKKFLPELIITAVLLLYSVTSIHAFGSSSASYKLEGEFGIFGGAKSSASYKLTDTGGGFAVGFGSSANYGTGSGFQYVLAEVREIIYTISKTSVDLGSLSSSTVSTDSHTIEVDTNGAGGYQVTVVEDNNLRTGGADIIDDVSDGFVNTAGGDEEYGLATSKAGQDISQWDAACDSSDPETASAITSSTQTVASASTPIDDDITTLCYAATITDATEAGSYSHILTYIATGTF